MKVDDLILQLQDLVNDAKSMPFSGGKVLVNSDDIYDIIDQIQDAMPAEVRQAKNIVADRKQIISEANRESENIIRAAEERRKIMLNQDELVKDAQAKAREILDAVSKGESLSPDPVALSYDEILALSFRLLPATALYEKDAVTVTGLRTRFSKLSWHTSYKAYVRAFKWVHGKKVYIGKASPEVHAITGGYNATYCNARSVTLSRRSLTLNVGRSKAVKARVKGVKKGRKLIRHGAAVRWYSSNVNVAVVDENGNITARDRGRCTVYALAMNGVRAKVNVTVK